MAIHGWNFNAGPIPDEIKRKFRERMKLQKEGKVVVAILAATCDTEEEKDAMTINATSERRRTHWETRKVAGNLVFGLYTYYK